MASVVGDSALSNLFPGDTLWKKVVDVASDDVSIVRLAAESYGKFKSRNDGDVAPDVPDIRAFYAYLTSPRAGEDGEHSYGCGPSPGGTASKVGSTGNCNIASGFDQLRVQRDKEARLAKATRVMMESLRTDPSIRCRNRKCKQKGRITVTLRQTRGGDEGSTAFLQCTACGATWKG